ncbi:MAG: efflux RND transporter permease subunit, partial [Sandaracinaceae bacterium]|nr:efflux RND transporter permease subunit [Sandaracinaceae bacterium]
VREGKTPVEAILEAGPARLRPILMTSAAMILGMLPSALSQGSGSEFRGPMAVGIIGGVISSTFLTLLVTPVFFLIMEWVTRVFVRKKKTRSPEEIEEALARARGAEPQAAE